MSEPGFVRIVVNSVDHTMQQRIVRWNSPQLCSINDASLINHNGVQGVVTYTESSDLNAATEQCVHHCLQRLNSFVIVPRRRARYSPAQSSKYPVVTYIL